MVSLLKVDKLDPQSGTALEIGTSGDTVTVPTGAGLTVTDEVKTNKVSPATGTAFALGDSGDTFTVPSGATLDISAATLTPPATMPASSGINLTSLNATNLGSGTVPTARLGTGTASSSVFLAGDNTWAAPSADIRLLKASASLVNTSTLDFNNMAGGGDSAPYISYRVIGRIMPNADNAGLNIRFKNSTTASSGSFYYGSTVGMYGDDGSATARESVIWADDTLVIGNGMDQRVAQVDLTYIPQNDTLGVQDYSTITGIVGGGYHGADDVMINAIWGYYAADQTHNGIQFYYSGTDITMYNIKIYGLVATNPLN